MAEKKTAETAAPQPVINERPKTVTIRLPREHKDQEDKIVWVNDKRYIIKRGVPVTVPTSVAEILEHSEKMRDQIYDFENRHAH